MLVSVFTDPVKWKPRNIIFLNKTTYLDDIIHTVFLVKLFTCRKSRFFRWSTFSRFERRVSSDAGAIARKGIINDTLLDMIWDINKLRFDVFKWQISSDFNCTQVKQWCYSRPATFALHIWVQMLFLAAKPFQWVTALTFHLFCFVILQNTPKN